MNSEKLFVEIIQQETLSAKEFDRRAHKIARKNAKNLAKRQLEEKARSQKDALKQEKLKPFNEIQIRNNAINSTVDRLTVSGPNVNRWRYGEYRNDKFYQIAKDGIVVILEDVPVTEVTQKHVAICLLSSVYLGKNKPESSSRSNYAQLRFAIIPKVNLDGVLTQRGLNPLIDVLEGDQMRTDFRTAGLYYINGLGQSLVKDDMDRRATRDYTHALQEQTLKIEDLEESFAWVLGAAQDKRLNSHLSSKVRQTAREAVAGYSVVHD
jgi:hypothetical protein